MLNRSRVSRHSAGSTTRSASPSIPTGWLRPSRRWRPHSAASTRSPSRAEWARTGATSAKPSPSELRFLGDFTRRSGARPRGRDGRAARARAARSVVLRSTIRALSGRRSHPVGVDPSGMAARPRRIMVGYDGSEAATRALDVAADLVGYGSTLAVVTVRTSESDHWMTDGRTRAAAAATRRSRLPRDERRAGQAAGEEGARAASRSARDRPPRQQLRCSDR